MFRFSSRSNRMRSEKASDEDVRGFNQSATGHIFLEQKQSRDLRFRKINDINFLERTSWSRLENLTKCRSLSVMIRITTLRFWHRAIECICSFRQCSRWFHAASRSRKTWIVRKLMIQFLLVWLEHSIYPHVSEHLRLSQRVVSIILKCIWAKRNKKSFHSCRNNVCSFVETLENPRIDDCFP